MDKTLVITGGSKGIGAATLEHFMHNHWKAFNLSRSPNPHKEVINISIDLSDCQQAAALKAQIEPLLGQKKLICLIHNAAHHLNDSIQNQDPIELTKALNVSLVFPSIINQLLIPWMKEGSSILYLGSTLSEKAVPHTASYSTIKHALVGMMRATCQDLAGQKIHTACICPGFTNTEMLRQHLSQDPNLLTWAKQKVSFKRLIEPEEIASLLYFAANNPVINGSVLHAHLGQLET